MLRPGINSDVQSPAKHVLQVLGLTEIDRPGDGHMLACVSWQSHEGRGGMSQPPPVCTDLPMWAAGTGWPVSAETQGLLWSLPETHACSSWAD